MQVLCIGDVVSSAGCDMVRKKLPGLKERYKLDLVIANGENSANGNGITPDSAEHLLNSGVDVITLGNHTFRQNSIITYLDEHPQVIRPLNFPKDTAGNGYYIHDLGYMQIAVVNLIGQVFMEPNNSPFEAIYELLPKLDAKVIIVDFHAEATSEKGAMGYALDGKVSALFGTHTHVQTGDAQVLPNGTGFITDLGMTGPTGSILGVEPSKVIYKMTTHMPVHFSNPETPCKMDGVIFDIDEKSGKCLRVIPIQI